MEIQQAIEHARKVAEEKYAEGMLCHANPNDDKLDGCIECAKEHEQLAEWLEELQQYRAIGTVEECREAREKQKAKMPTYEGDGYSDGEFVYDTRMCPNCGEYYEVGYDDYEYCPKCGQHLNKLRGAEK